MSLAYWNYYGEQWKDFKAEDVVVFLKDCFDSCEEKEQQDGNGSWEIKLGNFLKLLRWNIKVNWTTGVAVELEEIYMVMRCVSEDLTDGF